MFCFIEGITGIRVQHISKYGKSCSKGISLKSTMLESIAVILETYTPKINHVKYIAFIVGITGIRVQHISKYGKSCSKGLNLKSIMLNI